MLPLNIKKLPTKMGLYILGAFIAVTWIFVIYSVITCPEVKDTQQRGVTNKYVDFILDNIIQDSITVQLYKPMEDGARMYVKLGAVVHCKVQIEVIEKYTRSAKLKLTFDKYVHEDIFFLPFSSSPESIEIKTRRKIETIVNKTFIDDNRTEDIKQMYATKYRNFAESLSKFISEKKDEKEVTSDSASLETIDREI